MGRERAFTTWKLRVKDEEVEVYVRYQELNSGKGEDECRFIARAEKYGVKVEGTDIAKIKEDVYARLCDKVGIEWTPMLHVAFQSEVYLLGEERHTGKNGLTRIRFRISQEELSQDIDGKTLQKGYLGHPERAEYVGNIKFDNYQNAIYEDENGTGRAAFIPDTPENRMALNEINMRLAAVMDHLRDLLAPDNIQNTLTRVAEIKFLQLSAGEGEPNGE